MQKAIEKINYLIIIFIILLLPIFYIIDIVNACFADEILSIKYYQVLWFLIPVLLFIYLYNIEKRKIKLGVFDFLILILCIFNFIVCLFAIDFSTSWFGSYYRREGILSFIAYYLIFLNCKSIDDEKKINKIINTFIIVGVLQSLHSFFQVFFRNFLLPELVFKGNNFMASGFISNPNFLGSYIILLLGIVIMKFLSNKNYKIYFVLSIIFFVNLLFTQSTGPFLAFVFMLVFALIFLIIKKKLLIKRFLMLVICLVISYFAVGYSIPIKTAEDNSISENYTINYDLKQLFRASTGKMKIYDLPEEENNVVTQTEEILEEDKVSKENLYEKEIEEEATVKNEDNLNGLGSGRIMIWRNTLKLVPTYFWFGCGIDNFGYAYKWHYNNIYYDKAHNDFLQILVTQGIFVFITYLIFLSILLIKGMKSNKILTWSLLLSFIGYCVQSFTNISVVEVAPYFYIICGLLAAQIQKEKVE